MGGAGAAIGASSVMTMDAGATANSGRAVAAIPEPLNTAGAGVVIPREIFFPKAPGLPRPERFSGFNSATPEVPLPIQRR